MSKPRQQVAIRASKRSADQQVSPPSSTAYSRLLTLQRSAGNGAVQRLVAASISRSCSCGGCDACSTEDKALAEEGEPNNLQRAAMIHGTGYASPWANEADEVSAVKKGIWSPSSVDFAKTADKSGGTTGIGTFKGLLDWIEQQPVDSIDSLGLIGHGNGYRLALAGRIQTDGKVFLKDDASIDAAYLTDPAVAARIANLRNRFKRGAKMILYGCDTGTGQSLLDAVGTSFGVCAKGFSDEIIWCLDWFETKPPKIDSRGKVLKKASAPQTRTDCSAFEPDMRKLNPDVSSKTCSGGSALPPSPGGVPLGDTLDNGVQDDQAMYA